MHANNINRLRKLYLGIYMYIHIQATIINDKRGGHLKGRWEDLEVGKRWEKWCNYIAISKIRAILKEERKELIEKGGTVYS